MEVALFQKYDVNILAFIVLLTVFISSYNRVEKGFLNYKLFITLLVSVMVLLVLEIVTLKVDGQPGRIYYIMNKFSNSIFFALNPLPPLIWASYVDIELNSNETRTIKRLKILSIPAIMLSLIALSTPLTSLAFTIDSNNIYSRTLFIYFNTAVCIFYILYSFFLLIEKRGIIDKKSLYCFLMFPMPPVIGTIAQVGHYGVVSVWAGTTISVLLTYITIQNRKMNTDPLTGLYNRRQLNDYLDKKITDSVRGKSFSLLMIDIDDFKGVNDTYGHSLGDYYLEKTAKLIRESLRAQDFIARYGGDEFVVILDTLDQDHLELMVSRIKDNLSLFNLTSKVKLNLSIGYDIYKSESGQKSHDYFMYIDQLMYDEKRKKRAVKPCSC